MNKPSLMIIGCGDLGRRVGGALAQQGWGVTAVKRTPGQAQAGFSYRAADYAEPGSLDFAYALQPDFVLATFTPTTMDLDGYKRGFSAAAANLLSGLGAHQVERLIMVSSTRVYAENGGGEVNESSTLSSTDPRALAIIDAEQQLLASDQPTSVVRAAGIYGMPGGRLISKVASGRIAPPRPTRYTNRIHRDDCAALILHLITLSRQRKALAPVYNAVDDEPAPAHDVESWLAREMGITPAVQPVAEEDAEVTGKRLSNALILSSGFELRYPDYRAGYRQVLDSE